VRADRSANRGAFSAPSGGRVGRGERSRGVDRVEAPLPSAELAPDLDHAAFGKHRFDFRRAEHAQHRLHPAGGTGAAERERGRFEQAQVFLVEQPVQQLRHWQSDQFPGTDGRRELAQPRPAVEIGIRLAGQALDQQAARVLRVAGQMQHRVDLLGMGKVVAEQLRDAAVAQFDHALVGLASLRIDQRDRAARAGEQSAGDCLRRERVVPLGGGAQRALASALDDQQPHRVAALDLQHQRAVELDGGGQQRAGGQRLAEHRAQRRRIVVAIEHRPPGPFELGDGTAHGRTLEHESAQQVGHVGESGSGAGLTKGGRGAGGQFGSPPGADCASRTYSR
jgi:hypothetical protein